MKSFAAPLGWFLTLSIVWVKFAAIVSLAIVWSLVPLYTELLLPANSFASEEYESRWFKVAGYTAYDAIVYVDEYMGVNPNPGVELYAERFLKSLLL